MSNARPAAAGTFAAVATLALYLSFVTEPGPSALCFALAGLVGFLAAFVIFLRT